MTPKAQSTKEKIDWMDLSSVQFSQSIVSDSLQPHGLQHARPPGLSPTPGAGSNSCWVSDAIQPSHPLSPPSVFNLSQHQSFPMSQFFTSVGQSFGASASASIFPMNIQDWFPLRLTGLISLHSKGLSRIFSNTKSINFSVLSFLYGPTLRSIHDYQKNHSFD